MADEDSSFLDSFQTATIEIKVLSGSKDVPPAKLSIPIYMLLGNLLKYFCALPDSGACQYLAYIPSLPYFFQDFTA